MGVRIDTNALPEVDRKAFWREEVCQPYMYSAPIFRNEEAFTGTHTALLVGETVFMDTATSQYDVIRGSQEISRSPMDVVALMRERSGGRRFSQNGRNAALERGDFILLDSASPMSGAMAAAGSLQCIVMPRSALGRRIDEFENMTARTLSATSPAGVLLNDYTEMVLRLSPTQDERARAWLEGGFHDLIALSFGTAIDTLETGPATLRSARLETMLRQIDKHYRDPGLTPRAVAVKAGVSERYLHRLFEHSSMSFRQSLVRRRLTEARRCLKDIAEAHRSIADIAFASGFADLSGFNRAFKSAYGLTPRDMRSHMLHELSHVDRHAEV